MKNKYYTLKITLFKNNKRYTSYNVDLINFEKIIDLLKSTDCYSTIKFVFDNIRYKVSCFKSNNGYLFSLFENNKLVLSCHDNDTRNIFDFICFENVLFDSDNTRFMYEQLY